jgi:hypothetical protein
MQYSSDRVGALAAALAKAQAEITNPEKSLTATIVSPFAAWQPDLPLCAALLRARPGPQMPRPARDRNRTDDRHRP